jgi:hypothetical protein
MNMFEAFIIVCAGSLAHEIHDGSCFKITDDWGPYVSQENCDIRTKQMVDNVLHGTMTPLLFEMYFSLGVSAEKLYAEGHCSKLAGDNA